MYPYFRAARVILTGKQDNELKPFDPVELKLRVGVFDRDIYPELNNGRYLQMADLGRIDLAVRLGLFRQVRKNNMVLVGAGCSAQWRRRLRFGMRYTLRTQLLDVDERWFYFYHLFYSAKGKHASILFRAGVADVNGLVSIQKIANIMDFPDMKPQNHPWVLSWKESESYRPEL